jgi:S-adenosyl-L-methionine hydrolase (adenosine-forming)
MGMKPILTFTTDFGLADAYVAEMKGAVLKICPDATLVDVSHGIAPQDVAGGAFALERSIRAFPAGTIHVAVVDPGVGTNRKLMVAQVDGQVVFCPDNGLITWAYRRCPSVATQELLWRPTSGMSATFHGRDVLAPAAALVAAGKGDAVPTRRLDRPVLLDSLTPAGSLDDARVIHVDRYGNAITNVDASLLTRDAYVLEVGPIRRTYADVAPGDPVALIGSSGLLEIAVRNENAASQLGLVVGQRVTFRA